MLMPIAASKINTARNRTKIVAPLAGFVGLSESRLYFSLAYIMARIIITHLGYHSFKQALS